VRALGGDPAIHGQRAEQCQQHQNQRRDWRERPGRERRDTWLVPQRRKVIDTGQAHHLPPRVRVLLGLFLFLVGPFYIGPLALQ